MLQESGTGRVQALPEGVCTPLTRPAAHGSAVGRQERIVSQGSGEGRLRQGRASRNSIIWIWLSAPDRTQTADHPDPTKAKWQPCRQALRDVTNQDGYPRAIIWPTPLASRRFIVRKTGNAAMVPLSKT